MSSEPKIKVCGITRFEDAKLAVELGAFALGFVFYKKSPRYIRPEIARAIIEALPKKVTTVGVFVNESLEDIRTIQKISGVDVLQLHGDEDLTFVQELSDLRIWKAIRFKAEDQLKDLKLYHSYIEAFLFDAASQGAYGGTGHQLSEDLLSKIPRDKNFLIAGGLNPRNWRAVHNTYRPYAIDLSSGVESRPGIKDSQKLRDLFAKGGLQS